MAKPPDIRSAPPRQRDTTGSDTARSGRETTEGDAERIAVALTYKPDDADAAPVVSASGRGHLAERIVALAEELEIPVRADADLVEILAATEVGDEIPVEAFIAVAEILRYIYELNGRGPPTPERNDG